MLVSTDLSKYLVDALKCLLKDLLCISVYQRDLPHKSISHVTRVGDLSQTHTTQTAAGKHVLAALFLLIIMPLEATVSLSLSSSSYQMPITRTTWKSFVRVYVYVTITATIVNTCVCVCVRARTRISLSLSLSDVWKKAGRETEPCATCVGVS